MVGFSRTLVRDRSRDRRGGGWQHRDNPLPAAGLREEWRRHSLESVWADLPDEWHVPAVEAVCEALTRAGGGFRLTGACRRLGQERADAMMSLEETRDDLGVVARLQEPHRMASMLDSVTVGWVDAMAARWGSVGVIEPMDGFNSLIYLRARLDEVYAEAAVTGADVTQQWGIVVLDTVAPRNGMARHLVHETMHEALRFAFPGGESRVTLRPGRIGALVGRAEPRLSESLAVLRSELSRANETGRLLTVGTKLVGLPARHEDLAYVVEDLAT